MLSVLQSFVDLQNFRELLLVDALRFVYCTSQLPSISGQCRWRMRTTTSSKSFTHYLDDIIRFHVSSKGPLPKALRNLAPNIVSSNCDCKWTNILFISENSSGVFVCLAKRRRLTEWWNALRKNIATKTRVFSRRQVAEVFFQFQFFSLCKVWKWSYVGISHCFADTCYVLSFSIIMLNTSLHNPSVKDKVSHIRSLLLW